MKYQLLFIFLSWLSLPSVLAETHRGFNVAKTSEKRLALVIGNKDYQDAPLTNPLNDAHDMKAALEKLGFTVIHRENANLEQMDEAMHSFARQLDKETVALFYYSGHGVQADGINYLVPVGASITNKAEVKSRAYDANIALGTMEEAGVRISMVILDACRNAAFRGLRSQQGGLAQMGGGGRSSIIAFATAPGDTAEDGSGRNGTFTKHLLRHITETGVNAIEALQRVQTAVADETKDRQKPWINFGPLHGQFCFNACTLALPVSQAVASPPPDEWKKMGRYEVKNGLVKDAVTGLMWRRCSLGQYWEGATCQGTTAKYTLKEVTKELENSNFEGYQDWRVPTIEELKTLVHCNSGQPKEWNDMGKKCEGDYIVPTIDGEAFPKTATDVWFWSSSFHTFNRNQAWIVYFHDGDAYYDDKDYRYAVRLVREGKKEYFTPTNALFTE